MESIKKHNSRAVYSIYLVAFLDMLGFGVIIPVIRDITIFLSKESYLDGIGTAVLSGVLMSCYSLGQFFFAPILGGLSDRYGRKKILILSLVGNLLSYGIWCISHSYGLFLFSRLISGVSGSTISVAQSYVADITSKEDRGKAMGMLGALFGLGFVLGPFMGAVLSSFPPPTFLFKWINFNPFASIGLLCMVLSLTALVLAVFYLRESLPEANRNSKIVFNLHGIFRLQVSPVLYRLFLIYTIFYIVFVSLESTLAWDLKYRFQMDIRQTGFFFTYMGLVLVLIQGGIYRVLYKKYSSKLLIQVSLVCIGLAFLLYPHASTLLSYYLTIFLFTLGMGILSPTLTSTTSLISEDNERGKNMGLLQSGASLARAFVPFIATLLYDYFSHASVAYFSSGFILICLFVSFSLVGLPQIAGRKETSI